MYLSTYLCLCKCICICLHTYMYTYMYLSMLHTWTCFCVCMHVYAMYMHIHRHTEFLSKGLMFFAGVLVKFTYGRELGCFQATHVRSRHVQYLLFRGLRSLLAFSLSDYIPYILAECFKEGPGPLASSGLRLSQVCFGGSGSQHIPKSNRLAPSVASDSRCP